MNIIFRLQIVFIDRLQELKVKYLNHLLNMVK
jgi:hypothetical protein